MSEVGFIGLKDKDGIEYIDVNWTNLQRTGQQLLDHYPHPDDVVELIDLGNMSSLGDTLETCDVYGRDWGRENEGFRYARTTKSMMKLANRWNVVTVFLFDREYGWTVGSLDLGVFVSLRDLLENPNRVFRAVR